MSYLSNVSVFFRGILWKDNIGQPNVRGVTYMKKHALTLLLFLVSIVLLTTGSAGTLQELREDPENFWANPDQK